MVRSGQRRRLRDGGMLFRPQSLATMATPAHPLKRITGNSVLVGMFLGLVGIFLAIVVISLNALSGIRTFVHGEGLWSKAQKDAVTHLLQYASTGKELDYQNYQIAIAVTRGDRKARLELDRPTYDYTVVEQGLVEGGNDPQDIPNAVFLYRHFGRVSYMADAKRLWAEGDAHIDQLMQLAVELREARRHGQLSHESHSRFRERIALLNKQLTALERDFSSTLNEGARFVQDLLPIVIVFTAVTLFAAGLLLARRFSASNPH